MPNSFKHTSWGRTRGPKNLSGTQGDEVDVVLVGTLDSVHDGYATENQRYLHLLVSNGTANDATAGVRKVTVWGYNHAFQRWFPLLAYIDDDGAAAVALIAPDANGAENRTARKAQTFELFGVDRVAFVGVTADVRCFAACSTFQGEPMNAKKELDIQRFQLLKPS